MLNSIDSLPHWTHLPNCGAVKPSPVVIEQFPVFPVVTGGYRAKSNHRVELHRVELHIAAVELHCATTAARARDRIELWARDGGCVSDGGVDQHHTAVIDEHRTALTLGICVANRQALQLELRTGVQCERSGCSLSIDGRAHAPAPSEMSFRSIGPTSMGTESSLKTYPDGR
eukprot:556381-Prymnesium_polylepis.1